MSLNQILNQNNNGPLLSANLNVNTISAKGIYSDVMGAGTFDSVGLSSGSGVLVAGAATVVDAYCSASSVIILTFASAIGPTVGPLSVVTGAGSFNVAATNGGALPFNYVILN